MADWGRVKEIFGAALERPPAERAAFVTESCGGEDDLRAEVESLLSQHEDAGAFLETSALALVGERLSAREPAAAGERIGAYRLVAEIGRGGMGTVYLADREEGGFQHRVAIKLIRRGMDTDAIVRRFWNERQILAGLDHPFIARLFDGGSTDDGRPFFVMEHVDGTPIDRYCDERGLSIEERLVLFRKVCDAVQYAHRHLIVHRDLKPGNILVTPDGTPKLLDFGLGKVLDPGLEEEANLTQGPLQAMTPEYASPEQVSGGAVTTASDVYALGVLLYGLLTGRHPTPFPTRRPDEIARIVCEREPLRASAATSDPRRHRRLRGDLDTILEVALRKEPARRYPSVERFSDDVRRHLLALPVTARGDTLVYRGGKLVRRHKVAVAAAALVFVTLVAGITGTTWQMRTARAERARAEQRFADVRRMAHLLIFDYGQAIQSLPGSLPVRERLVRDAFAYLEELSREAEGDLELQRELADGYEHVGNLQALAGDIEGSLVSHRRSLDIQRRLVEQRPGDLAARRDLARRHAYVADRLTDTGRADRALAHHEAAFALREEIVRGAPGERAALLELYDSVTYLGRALQSLGRYEEALTLLQRAVSGSDSLAAVDPDPVLAENAMTVHHTYAGVLLAAGDPGAAAEQYRLAVLTAERLAAADPLNTNRRQALLRTRARLGHAWTLSGRPVEGRKELDEAYRVARRLADEEPTIIERLLDLVGIHTMRAGALESLGLRGEALADLRAAVEIGERAVARDPAHIRGRIRLVAARRELARLLARAGHAEEGVRHANAAVGELVSLVARNPASVELRRDLADGYDALGETHVSRAAELSGAAAERVRAAGCTAYGEAAAVRNALGEEAIRARTRDGRPLVAPPEICRGLVAVGFPVSGFPREGARSPSR